MNRIGRPDGESSRTAVGYGRKVIMSDALDARLEFRALESGDSAADVGDEVQRGLSCTPKTLPCKLFYDSAGSELFERICRLPEYYLTRTEQAILCERADSIARVAGRVEDIIELGSGSSLKTRILIEAFQDRQGALRYVPIDISAGFLRESAVALLADYQGLSICAIAGEYASALQSLPERRGSRLFLFLGSNIGNFDPNEAAEFLRGIRNQMSRDDHLLIGVDRVKDREILEAAYNDSAGVTAEFNLNLLRRINAELGGKFDPESFEHFAPYITERSRIEMRLISRRDQTVEVGALDRHFHFAEGEYIHTENSHKYTLAAFASICSKAGLAIQEHWEDELGWFSVMLLKLDSSA